jgi:hypothetical protein
MTSIDSDDDDIPFVAQNVNNSRSSSSSSSNHSQKQNDKKEEQDEDDIPLTSVSSAAFPTVQEKTKKAVPKKKKTVNIITNEVDIVNFLNEDVASASTSAATTTTSKPPKKPSTRKKPSKKEENENETENIPPSLDKDSDVPVAPVAVEKIVVEKIKKPVAATSAAATATALATSSSSSSSNKISDDVTVQNMILEYLLQHKRPVNTQSMTDALGSKVSKNNVQKALDALVEEKKIQKKDFKKIVIYFPIVAPLNLAQLEKQAKEEQEQQSEEEIAAAEKLKQDLLEINADNLQIEKLIREQRQLLQSKTQNVPILHLEQMHRQMIEEVRKLKTSLDELDRQEKEQEEIDLSREREKTQKMKNSSSSSITATANQVGSTRSLFEEKLSLFRVLPQNQQQQQQPNFQNQNRNHLHHHALDDFESVREKVTECQRLRKLYFERKFLVLDIVEFLSGDRRPRDAFAEFGLMPEEEMKKSLTAEDWEAAHFKF